MFGGVLDGVKLVAVDLEGRWSVEGVLGGGGVVGGWRGLTVCVAQGVYALIHSMKFKKCIIV